MLERVVDEGERDGPAPASPARATSWRGRRPPDCGRRRRGSAGRPAAARRRPRPRPAGSSGRPPWNSHASMSASPSWRQVSTRNAPEPIAGSQTLRSRICSGCGRPTVRSAQAREDGLERRAHDRLGQRARRVVRARAAPLLARLQHHRARRHEVGRGVAVDDRLERRVEVLERRGLPRRPS